MKIALVGYGKMGKAIEEIALERGHVIGLKINSSNPGEFNEKNLSSCEVAIEFTGPRSAFANIKKCLEAGIPVISGSTGWLDKWNEIEKTQKERKGSLLYSSNFSIGVNIFFEINQRLAALMKSHPAYDPTIEEIHHTQKKDAPSGTAITLAEQIISLSDRKKKWVNSESNNPEELVITSHRIDPTPGTHVVSWRSEIDDLEIRHTAHSRKGFALGAVLAAEFIKDKTGIFSMKDVLRLAE